MVQKSIWWLAWLLSLDLSTNNLYSHEVTAAAAAPLIDFIHLSILWQKSSIQVHHTDPSDLIEQSLRWMCVTLHIKQTAGLGFNSSAYSEINAQL